MFFFCLVKHHFTDDSSENLLSFDKGWQMQIAIHWLFRGLSKPILRLPAESIQVNNNLLWLYYKLGKGREKKYISGFGWNNKIYMSSWKNILYRSPNLANTRPKTLRNYCIPLRKSLWFLFFCVRFICLFKYWSFCNLYRTSIQSQTPKSNSAY